MCRLQINNCDRNRYHSGHSPCVLDTVLSWVFYGVRKNGTINGQGISSEMASTSKKQNKPIF